MTSKKFVASGGIVLAQLFLSLPVGAVPSVEPWPVRIRATSTEFVISNVSGDYLTVTLLVSGGNFAFEGSCETAHYLPAGKSHAIKIRPKMTGLPVDYSIQVKQFEIKSLSELRDTLNQKSATTKPAPPEVVQKIEVTKCQSR